MRHLYFTFLCICFITFTSSLKAQYKTLEFIENKGQWEGSHQYLATTETENIYFEKNAFTYTLSDPKNLESLKKIKEGGLPYGTIFKYHTYKITFLGANANCEMLPSKIAPHYYNYFLGKDPSRWKSSIHPARALDYKNLYQGIDMHLATENQTLKYEFIVAAGADPSQIKLQFTGQDKLSIKNGNLLITTSVGVVKELKPYTYQLVAGMKQELSCNYQIHEGNIVSFTFPKGYDASKWMVIDPTVIFSTFTGASADNWGFTATYDQLGNFYAGGIVHYIIPSNTFPTSVGAFQTVYNGGSTTTGSQYACDMVLFKYNAQGSAYLYATFLGGTDNDQPHSLVVDAANNLIIVGKTYSSNFPTTTGAYDVTHNGGADIVVTKLNATGTALLGSTYIGGSGDDGVNENAIEQIQGVLKHNFGDDARSEVIVDNAGNIYFASCTFSSNFPTTTNAYQGTAQGGQDGIIVKLNNNLTSVIWSTYLGGSINDAAYVLALNKQQSYLYVAGGTRSTNFPSTPGSYQTSYMGGTVDGFIGRFLNSGTYGLDKMTFIGTNNYDQCYGIQVDNENSVYAMGQTLGGTFPVTSGVYSNPGSSQFVMKLDSMLVAPIYSTVFGSGSSTVTNISPVAFLVDTCQNVYISGWGGNLGFSFAGVGTTTGMYVSSNAAQPTTDGNDFYFFVLAKNAINPLYATYWGGNGPQEHVDGGTSRFDKNGVVYQAICGGCGGTSNFPTTVGSVSTINGSANCNLAAVKIAFELGIVDAVAAANPDTVGCAPFLVNFNNGSTNATSYSWTFGDGGSSTLPNPTHTYLNPGTYTVRMIATNPNACKVSDTVFLQVVVLNNSILPNVLTTKVDSCGPYTATFANNTQAPPQGTTTYSWDFGDGTTSNLKNPPMHAFPDTGCYTVRLIVTNPQACKSPDTLIQKVCFNVITLKAAFLIPDTLCINMVGQFSSTSTNATSVQWSFGDGGNSFTATTTHTYTSPGLYTVRMIATNPAACKKNDTVTQQLYVSANVIKADFSFNKIDTCKPFTATFQNTSQLGTTPGASNFTKFQWDFGEGTTSNLMNPPLHQFPDSGCYDVRLIMSDSTACNTPDTIIKRICFNAILVKAAFIAPDSVCLNNGALFANHSTNGLSYSWNFGDGQTSIVTSPVHTYLAPGMYIVTLIAGNPNSCNKFDTATWTIKIKKLPKADFIHSPIVPVGNELTVFTNRSKDATSYNWSFGDGTGSNDKDPTHQYKKTLTYRVCLTAKDDQGCADTICKSVDALVIPAIGVPTAFSPNGDGANDILFVYGAAVETVSFKLYNRWGQLVFETNSLTKGWDGTFKGKPQEMDSYAYTLYATFYDGTNASKEGNVTLLK